MEARSLSFNKMEKFPLLGKKEAATFKAQWPQHLASMSANLIAFSSGCVAGWAAPAIPHLQGTLGSRKILSLTPHQTSWIGSIHTLGAAVGSLPAGALAGIFGRKWFLLSLAVPMIIGWAVILCGYENVHLIYLGRFICGLPFGAMGVVAPMYNNEIADENIRGAVGVYFDVAWCAGILFAYIVGAYTSFWWLTFSCFLAPFIFALTFVFMPESPVHLLMINKPGSADKAIRWFRRGERKEERAATELRKLQELLNEEAAQFDSKRSQFNLFKLHIKNMSGSTSYVAILIGFGLMTCQKLSGVSAFLIYTVDIFDKANTNMAPEIATIIVGTSCLLSALVSALFVDRLGRRTLLVVSGAAMSVSLLVMSVYTLIIQQSGNSEKSILDDIPVISLCFFHAMYRVGYGPIPWLMIAELLPNNVKLWICSIIICYSWFINFLVTKSFPILVHTLGSESVFAIYFMFNLMGFWFAFEYVPETMYRSVNEIQKELTTKYSNTK